MARIRVCAECSKPVAECICDDEDPGEQDGGEDGDAA